MALPELLANSTVPGALTPLATLSAAMTDTTGLSASVSTAAPTQLRATTGQYRVVVDSEIMLVAASSSGASPWTVLTRGAEGSTATTHLTGANVYHYLTAAALFAATAPSATGVSGDYNVSEVSGAAPLASPTFTGTVNIPTPTSGDSSTKAASTAFVAAALLIASTQQASSYTFALTDVLTVVESTSATAVTFTIPPHSSVACPVGAVVEVFQDGAGQITIAAGAGVTLRSDGAKVKTAAQYATVGLRQRATDEWVLSGDLA